MSQNTTLTTYAITYTVTHTADGSYDMASFNLELPAWNDAAVSTLVQALEAIPVPAGCTSQATVGKNTTVTTVFTTNAAASPNPITFT